MHLTLGVDTHLWSLSYAHMRQHALTRARQSHTLPDGSPLTKLPLPSWACLHAPLPVGFLAAPALEALCSSATQHSTAASSSSSSSSSSPSSSPSASSLSSASTLSLDAAQHALCEAMVSNPGGVTTARPRPPA